MKGVRITGIILFLTAAIATPGSSTEGVSSGALHPLLLPPVQCADIVRAGVLPSDQAELLRSREFADSMDAVASGSSRYSPGFVPPEWRPAASAWREQVAARAIVPPAAMTAVESGEGICDASLIFRAFLDYRAKTGRSDLKPVYPYQARKASADLAERFERVAQRARRIESSILEAERMGARECSPSELSIAWAELEVAGRQSAENGYDIGKTEAAFGNAERAAANLLVKRQVASSQKFVCYSR